MALDEFLTETREADKVAYKQLLRNHDNSPYEIKKTMHLRKQLVFTIPGRSTGTGTIFRSKIGMVNN